MIGAHNAKTYTTLCQTPLVSLAALARNCSRMMYGGAYSYWEADGRAAVHARSGTMLKAKCTCSPAKPKAEPEVTTLWLDTKEAEEQEGMVPPCRSRRSRRALVRR